MDSHDLTMLQAEERHILNNVIAALRSELCAPLDARCVSTRRQHFKFLSEVLRRHARRAFGLAEHGESMQFAVDWQGDCGRTATLRVNHLELTAELNGILDEAFALDESDLAGQATDRERLRSFLCRLEDYLGDEQFGLSYDAQFAQPVGA